MIIHDYSWWEDFPTKPPFGVTLEHRVLVHLGFLLSHGLRFDRSAPLLNPFNPKYQSLFINFSKPVLNLEPKDNCRSDWGQGWPREWVSYDHIVSYLFTYCDVSGSTILMFVILFLLVASSNSLSLELSNPHSLACWSQQPSYSLTSMSATWPLRRVSKDGSLTLWIWGDNATWPLSPQMVQVTLGASLDTTCCHLEMIRANSSHPAILSATSQR